MNEQQTENNLSKIEKAGWVLPYIVWDILKNEKPEDVVEVINICIEYDRNWQKYQQQEIDTGKLSPLARVSFGFARNLIDGNNTKYFAQVEKNRKNGKKGGRPKKDADKNENNPEKPNGLNTKIIKPPDNPT